MIGMFKRNTLSKKKKKAKKDAMDAIIPGQEGIPGMVRMSIASLSWDAFVHSSGLSGETEGKAMISSNHKR